MPRGELHVQLFVDYGEDEKLAFVSRSARLLYIDGLCMAKRLLTDGTLTKLQVERLMHPERPGVAERTAAELVESGAWSWDGRRRAYVITAFLKRNKSRAQVVAERKAAEERSARANHRRWHEAQGRVDESCQFCSKSGSQDGSQQGSGSGSHDGTRSESTETETETETELVKIKPSRSPSASTTPKPGTDDDPQFVRFWAAYPRRAGKGQARKAWAQAIKGADPETIVEAAGRFTAQRGHEDPKFTPYPATWLNGERWTDVPDPEPTREPGPVMPWELWD